MHIYASTCAVLIRKIKLKIKSKWNLDKMPKQNDRKRNVYRAVYTGLLSKMINLFFPFIIRTLLIHKLGTEYVGLDSLFTAILQVLSLTELGFCSAMVSNMYRPIAENDYILTNALLNFYRKVYIYIGWLIFVIGLVLIPVLPHLIKDGYPSAINIYILYLIFLFNSVVSYFLCAYRSSLFTALQRTDLNNNIDSLSKALMYVAQIMILVLIPNYYLYVIWIPLCTIVVNLVREYISRRLYPQYHPENQISKELKKEIYKRVGALAGHKLGSVVTSSICNIFISAYLGLGILGIFNNYYYILNAVMGVIVIFYNALLGSIGNSIASESVEKNFKDFKQVMLFYMWIIGVCTTLLLCLYQPFMRLWLGEKMMVSMDIVFVLCLYFLVWKAIDVIKIYKDAAGMWWADKYKPYVSVMVNILLNFFFIGELGITGVLLSTIICQLFIELPWSVYVFFKLYFKKSQWYFYSRFLPYMLCIIGVAYICYLVSEKLDIANQFVGFIIKAFVTLVITNVLYIVLTYKSIEFLPVKNKINKILKL